MTQTQASVPETRTSRYGGILPPEGLAQLHVQIVGVGAIGRQVALMLAAMGVGRVDMTDPDTVSPANMGAQGYRPDQVGRPKVEATREDMLRINPEMQVSIEPWRWSILHTQGSVLFLCVDNMESRRFVVQNFLAHVGSDPSPNKAVIDARMGAEQCRVLSLKTRADCDAWYSGWFPDARAASATCTAKSTIYCASMAAAIMVGVLAKYVRGHHVPHTTFVDLWAGGMDHEDLPPDEEDPTDEELSLAGVSDLSAPVGPQVTPVPEALYPGTDPSESEVQAARRLRRDYLEYSNEGDDPDSDDPVPERWRLRLPDGSYTEWEDVDEDEGLVVVRGSGSSGLAPLSMVTADTAAEEYRVVAESAFPVPQGETWLNMFGYAHPDWADRYSRNLSQDQDPDYEQSIVTSDAYGVRPHADGTYSIVPYGEEGDIASRFMTRDEAEEAIRCLVDPTVIPYSTSGYVHGAEGQPRWIHKCLAHVPDALYIHSWPGVDEGVSEDTRWYLSPAAEAIVRQRRNSTDRPETATDRPETAF